MIHRCHDAISPCHSVCPSTICDSVIKVPRVDCPTQHFNLLSQVNSIIHVSVNQIQTLENVRLTASFNSSGVRNHLVLRFPSCQVTIQYLSRLKEPAQEFHDPVFFENIEAHNSHIDDALSQTSKKSSGAMHPCSNGEKHAVSVYQIPYNKYTMKMTLILYLLIHPQAAVEFRNRGLIRVRNPTMHARVTPADTIS